jgi:uncharacterized NAD(P)/FAD-binding protein YdhS
MGQFTHTVLGLNSFRFLDSPVMLDIWPPVLPIVNVDMQEVDELDRVMISGTNFDVDGAYECVFRRTKATFNLLYRSAITVLSSTQVQCDVPYTPRYPLGLNHTEFITLRVELLLQTGEKLQVKG